MQRNDDNSARSAGSRATPPAMSRFLAQSAGADPPTGSPVGPSAGAERDRETERQRETYPPQPEPRGPPTFRTGSMVQQPQWQHPAQFLPLHQQQPLQPAPLQQYPARAVGTAVPPLGLEIQQLRDELARMASSQEAMLSRQQALERALEEERSERQALQSRVHELEGRSNGGRGQDSARRKTGWRGAFRAEEGQPPPSESGSANVDAADSGNRRLPPVQNDKTQDEAKLELRCVHGCVACLCL